MAQAEADADAQIEAMSSMLMPMLVLLLMMVLISTNSWLRLLLADGAGSVIEPVVPFHSIYIVPTVFLVGSSIMVFSTILRAVFFDPLWQAHHGHRGRQIGRVLREARMNRDTAMIDKMERMQMSLMPDTMKMQSSLMRQMTFSIVFIMAIFSWMGNSVENFRVGFVSLPWVPMWSFQAKIFWIFPAWIATYIAMSAPLGRILDRHIKIFRYSRHPLVLSGATIDEPLLHILNDAKSDRSSNRGRRPQRRAGPKKTGKHRGPKSGNLHSAPPKIGEICQSCESDMISRTAKGALRCEVCRNEWR